MCKRHLLFCFVLLNQFCWGQQHYFVYFKDKKECTYNPYQYLSAKAIERRIKEGINLYDSTDFPVNQHYVKQLNKLADSVGYISRWFNGAVVYGNECLPEKCLELPFVKEVAVLPKWNKALAVKEVNSLLINKKHLKEVLIKQTAIHGDSLFKFNNINGKGVLIAVFDAGFPDVNTHHAFDHLIKENRILATYDFIKKKEFVYGHDSHGTMVLSCIAGITEGIPLGMGTGAQFLLARTEHGQLEPYSEEENWLAAAEWADKNGADIINSSLGYTNDRYFREQMNGKYSLVAKAATMAARKGILVCNAAGNEGDESWEIIGTPADADSILTVGGVERTRNLHIDFSSYGPTADHRLKPNICAMGSTYVAGKNQHLAQADGTSFSTPLVSGFAACVLQLHPEYTGQQLLNEIQKSAELFPYYDYAHGFGVPQANYFMTPKPTTKDSTFSVNINTEVYMIALTPHNTFPETYVYSHVQNIEGYLSYYRVTKVTNGQQIRFTLRDLQSGDKLRIHYLGFTYEYQNP